LIRKAMVLGPAAYAAPMVLGTPTSALAAAVISAPSCTASVCPSVLHTCQANPNCYCFATSTGGSFCLDGNAPVVCGQLTACSVQSPCGPGFVCTVDTCCSQIPGAGVCIPTSAACGATPGLNGLAGSSLPAGTLTPIGIR
jgi:hypothetical protein